MKFVARGRFMTRFSPVSLGILLAACEFLTGQATRDWSEEVGLDDGRVITIGRHVEFKATNSLSGDAYSSTETRSTLSFRGDLSTIPPWDVPLVPLVLYRDPATAEWVIVAATRNCETWFARGMPPTLYWEFRARGATWVETPVSQDSFGRKTNLLIIYEQNLPKTFFKVADKVALQGRGDVAREVYEILDADNARVCR